jgi:hypothetical protein
MLDVYNNQHETKRLSKNVIRGVSKDSSAEFENLFGIMIGELFGLEYTVLVGYQIHYLLNGNWKSFKKPDILVYKNDTKEIECIFDLKNDIGLHAPNWFIEANNWLNGFYTGEKHRYTEKVTKNKVEIKLIEDTEYFLILLNRGNSRDKLMQYSIELRRERKVNRKLKRFPLSVLMNPISLNGGNKVEPVHIKDKKNKKEWKKLESWLRKWVEKRPV